MSPTLSLFRGDPLLLQELGKLFQVFLQNFAVLGLPRDLLQLLDSFTASSAGAQGYGEDPLGVVLSLCSQLALWLRGLKAALGHQPHTSPTEHLRTCANPLA